MRILKITLTFSAALMLLLSSCVRENKFFETGNTETPKSFLRILEAPENKLFYEPFSGTRNVQLFAVRRDANTEGELGKSATVTFRIDTAAIRAYNTANNESFQMLPDSLFTLVGSSFTKTGPLTYTTTFAPGEFSKEFIIALNGSKWNLSRKYAFPVVIQDAGGLTLRTGQERVNTFISVKNKWDGVYTITGTMVDNASATLTGEYPLEWDLVTSGPNQLIQFDNVYLGIPGHIINAGGSLSYYGAYGLVINIDPNTNKITSVTNYYGQPSGNGRSAQLDPSGRNEYDPATKSFYIKYWMMQPAVVPNGPRVVFDEVWKYKGPRK